MGSCLQERFDLEWISQMVDLTSLPAEYANLDEEVRWSNKN